MTTAETIRYNVARLVNAYARTRELEYSAAVLAVALAAWPPPLRLARQNALKEREQRRRRLRRYISGDVTPPDPALEQLAAALEVDPAEFRKPPSN